jgi:hypothetical protein
MNKFPLSKAEFVGFFLESFLCGIANPTSRYAPDAKLTFFQGFATLLYILTLALRRGCSRVILPSSAMMALSILRMFISLIRILEGFIYNADGPEAYFSQTWKWSYLLKASLFLVLTCIADSFGIYRIYVLWRGPWLGSVIVTFASLTLMANLGQFEVSFHLHRLTVDKPRASE